jgi:hypothetical protein
VGENGNITVTASNSCGTSTASTLAVSVVNANNIGFNGDFNDDDLTVCQGTTATIVSGDNPTDGQDFLWQVATAGPAGPFSTVSPNPGDVEDWTISSTYFGNPGTYYFRRVISGNTNCNGNSDVVTFTVNPSPTVNALTGTQTVCVGLTTTFSSTTPGGVFSTSNASVATVDPGTGVITGVSSTVNGGVATISYTVTDPGNGCSTTVTRQVTVSSALAQPGNFTASQAVVCPNATGVVYTIPAVTGAVNYTWSLPAGWNITTGGAGTSITVTTSSASGDVSVVANNGCGSSAPRTIAVTVTAFNNVGFNGNLDLDELTICRGTPTTIVSGDNPPTGQNYQWQVDDNLGFSSPANAAGTTDNDEDYTVDNDYYDVAGTYYFRRVITNNATCNGNSDVVKLIVIPSATITTTGTLTAICFSNNPQSASLAYSATTGNPTSYSIDWNSGINDQPATDFSFAAGGGTITQIQIQLEAPIGTHTGTMTISNGVDCSTTQAVSITIAGPPAPVQTITGPTAVCSVEGGLVYSVASQPAPGVTYFWTIPAGWQFTSGQNTNSITVTSGNIGQVGDIAVTVSNSCGPSGSGTLTVGYLDDIGYGGVPTANSSTTCAGVAPLQPIIGGAAPSGPAYQWQVSINGGNFNNAVGSSTNVDYFINSTYYSAAGTYVFRRVISSSTTACNGNSDNVTLIVNTVPPVAPLTGLQTICAGSTTTFTTTTGSGVWSTDNPGVATVSGGTVEGISGGSANISYTVTGGNGCPTTVSRSVTVIATPTAVTALPLTSAICFPGSVNLNGSANIVSPVTLIGDNFNSVGTLFTSAGTTTGGVIFSRQSSGFIAGVFPITNNDGTQFMIADAASFGAATTSSTLTTSPLINTTGFTTLNLTFRHTYDMGNSDGVSVQVSTDPGNTVWNSVVSYNTAQGAANNFVPVSIDLTPYINQPNFKFRFNFNSTVNFNVSWWAIDDVQLTGTPAVLYSWTANTAPAINGLPVGAGTPSASNNIISVNPSAATTYTLNVTANGCSASSSGSVVTVNQPPTISNADPQTICGNDDVFLSVGASGTGALPLIWSSISGNDAGFTFNPGDPNKLAPTYTPSFDDIQFGSVTLIVKSQIPSAPCVQASESIIITINQPATADAGDAQTICAGESTFLEGSKSGDVTTLWTATYGNGIVAGTFSDATNVGSEFTPNAGAIAAGQVTLTLTTSDPDGDGPDGGPCEAASDVMILTIRPSFTAGEINTTGETVCNGGDPGTIGSVTAASGGNGVITYKWQANGADIDGANGPTYNPPPGTFGTTIYTRFAKDGECNKTFTQSVGSWTVVLYPSFTAGAIQTTGQTVCDGGNPGPIGSLIAAGGGDGDITYKWQANGDDIPGADEATYDPPAGVFGITVYTRFAKDGCNTTFTQSTGSWTVVLYPTFTAGAINTTGQTICYAGDPAPIGSATAAGGGDSQIEYEWRANGSPISGSDNASYDPPSGLTSTTTYTRFARDGTCNPSFTQSTGSWTVTVHPQFTAGAINTTGESICPGGDPATIGSATDAGGGYGTIVYKWQANGADIASSNSEAYNPPSGLTTTTTYTRFAKDGTCNTTFTQSTGSWTVTVYVGPTVINDKSTQTLVYGAPIAPVTVTATDTDTPGSSLEIDAVSYTLDGGSSTAGLPESLSITANSPGTNSKTWTISGCMKGTGPGTYCIKVKIKDNCGTTGYTTFNIVVKPGLVAPVAEAYYTGATFFWTTGPSSSTATLTLAATIKNAVDNCADITTGRISFYVRTSTGLTPINGAQNLPVGLVDPSNPNVGAASAIVQYNIGNLTMCPLDIAVVVGGNYAGGSDPSTEKQITLAVPLPGGQIVGGGTLDNLTSSGYIGGSSSKKTCYSIEVKYNKSLTNPQGRIELTILSYRTPAGVLDTKCHVYKVKSTAISTLAVGKPTVADAQFSSKVNVTEILANGTSVGIESGIPFVMDIYDGNLATSSPKPPDKIGVTIYRKNGGVWYSNNWDVNKTVMKAILMVSFLQVQQLLRSSRSKVS